MREPSPMTNRASLTNEELERLESWTFDDDKRHTPNCPWCDTPHLHAARIVADLRAARDRCAVLIGYIHDMERRLCPCPEHEQQRAVSSE